MALKQELNKIVDLYQTEIGHIEQFLKSVEQSLTRKQKRKPKKPFSKEEAGQLREVGESIEKAIKDSTFERISINVSDEIASYIIQLAIPIKQKEFLAEMTLGYLVSYQEGFTKDYLYQILVHKKEMLKSSASLSYEQILNYTSIKSLVSSMAQEEVDGIGYGSIDDIAFYFKRKLNIELSEFNEWETYREINYRRNILIHNRGHTNDIYCKKVGYKKRNKHLSTTYQYVSNAAVVFRSFIDFVHEATLKKLKLNET